MALLNPLLRPQLRQTCCLLHALPGAFAADRTPRATSEAEPDSFSDETSQERSTLVGDYTETQGLYERADREQWIAIIGGTVLARRGRALPNHDVLVRGGMIEVVQATGQPLPDGAIVIDARDRFVVPGFSDMHTHPYTYHWVLAHAPLLGMTIDPPAMVMPYDLQMFQYLAAGVTRIEVMAGCADILAVRDDIAAGRLVGPRMQVGSPLIDGFPPIHSPLISWIAADREGGQRAAQETAARGFDFAKPYSHLNREAFAGLVEECQKLGIRMMGHVPAAVGIPDAIAMGQRGIAHAAEYFYNERGAQRYDEDRLREFAKLSADNDVTVQATLIVSERMEALFGKRQLNAPDQAYMHPLHRKIFGPDTPFVEMLRADPDKAYLADDNYRLSSVVTKALHEAGAVVLTGTDVPNPFIVDGFSLHEEFEHLVAAGLSSPDVLHATTLQGAEHHGDGHIAGTVETGRISDLVVLRHDPSTDIRATRSVETVVVGDVILRRDRIERGLSRIREIYAGMAV